MGARNAATRLVVRELNIHDLPASPTARRSLIESAGFTERLDGALADIWDPSVYQTERAQALADLRLRARTPAMEMQEAARIGTPKFEHVQMHGNTAKVVFVATSSRRSSTSHAWIGEGRSRFECLLRRSSDGPWRLVSLASEALDGQG